MVLGMDRALESAVVAGSNAEHPRVRPVKIGFQKRQVQGELSLENMKVVRNDLSEADVAVVPVKTTVDAETGNRAAGGARRKPPS